MEREEGELKTCEHIYAIRDIPPGAANGCEDCLKTGGRWVHLRLCKSCGHVGCCDSSPNQHATGHYQKTRHPIIQSFEPNEDWGYCYVDDLFYKHLPEMK